MSLQLIWRARNGTAMSSLFIPALGFGKVSEGERENFSVFPLASSVLSVMKSVAKLRFNLLPHLRLSQHHWDLLHNWDRDRAAKSV